MIDALKAAVLIGLFAFISPAATAGVLSFAVLGGAATASLTH